MTNFKIVRIGQFADISVEFGDLTLLTGSQGTGKSIFLQLFKLTLDQDYIKDAMTQFGQDWNKQNRQEFIGAYLGEGMRHIWVPQKSQVFYAGENGEKVSPSPRMKNSGCGVNAETVYYIPAQRVLTMLTGWPQPYRSYLPGDPFVVKNFSERIRVYLEKLKERETIFPIPQKIKEPVRKVLDDAIFHGASVLRDTANGRKEVRLKVDKNVDQAISYMAWSTGQREFFPLLLGCYELLPAGKITKLGFEWVILEEPEMGLHPMGIFAVITLILDLLNRGYKVIVATHSPHVLEVVWSIVNIGRQTLSREKKIELTSKLLDLPHNDSGIFNMMSKLLTLKFKTYCFRYEKNKNMVYSTDISSLDPGDEDEAVAGWGGLTAYSARVSDIVAESVENAVNG
jgi:predicted ATPase